MRRKTPHDTTRTPSAFKIPVGVVPAVTGMGIPSVVALWVRLAGLGDDSLWFDEILTAERAMMPVGEMVHNALAGMHYPPFLDSNPWLSDSLVPTRRVCGCCRLCSAQQPPPFWR
ncbi:MAG: hypothetical protein FD153_535 [Rhodospirillaceae bacterium]|nr:MAG: hypothetical protein FD153_535 [Rhodospirillaceae bacterium]